MAQQKIARPRRQLPRLWTKCKVGPHRTGAFLLGFAAFSDRSALSQTAPSVALCRISAHCVVETLLSSILKTFEHKNPNIQGACLDLTISLLTGKQQQEACGTFGSAKQVRHPQHLWPSGRIDLKALRLSSLRIVHA